MNSLISSCLEKAIKEHIPDYFSWDEQAQEKYRMFLPDDVRFKIQQYIYRDLFDIAVGNRDELDDAWDELSEENRLKFNATMLPLQGIGKDCFFLNEYFDIGKSLLDFETLYQYDFNDFKFQESARKSQVNYWAQIYRGSLYAVWARLLINSDFYYATLSMVSGYFLMQLDEFGEDYIEELIPYNFFPGEDHDKETENGCSIWDMQINANGLEPQLEELKRRFWKYIEEAQERIKIDYNARAEQKVLILNESRTDDPHMHFLFSDQRILRRIRFRNFMDDCRRHECKDHSELLKQIDEEKNKLKNFLDAQYKDICALSAI
ncbi:MAG: hypothetical protein AB1403_02645 [Candidatus Riflebacteria bacterium]